MDFYKVRRIIIEVLLLVAFFWLLFKISGCWTEYKNKNIHSGIDSTQTTKTSIKLTYQEKPKSIVGQPIHIIDSFPVLINAPIDTLAVIRNYYRENNYLDTIKDSILLAVLNIKIAQNRLKEPPKMSYKILIPQIEKTITITNTITKTDTINQAKCFLLVGLRVGVNQKLLGAIAPEVILVLKNKKAIGFSYDLINKSYNASAYIPIKFK